jgi:hypothetical protein
VRGGKPASGDELAGKINSLNTLAL